MATISLYANTINQMTGLINEVKKSVTDYRSELSALNRKTLQINKNVCDLDDIVSSVQASSQTQEQKIVSLESFRRDSEQFVEDTVRTDGDVADIIKRRKDDFYNQYYYLKPECEKNNWEKFCDGCKKVGAWCKEHWKIIVTVVLVITAIVVIVCTAGVALGPIATILVGAAKGLICGAITGGLLGGLSSVSAGGSFLDGFENGAFTGMLTGALFGGLGGAGQVFGKIFGASCKIFKVIKYTSMVSGGLSLGMAGFDLLSLGAGLFLGQDNPLTSFNSKMHSNAAYNGFQFVVSAIAVFSGSAYQTMKPMPKTCFVAGTMIFTASGLVAIENIKVGDRVISTDTDTFETTEKAVVATYIHKVLQLVHLTVNGELISTTADHPFYVKNHGFVNAGALVAGSEVLDSKGKPYLIEHIFTEVVKEPITVYNFQVEDYHTYHVGNYGILVHNSQCEPMGHRNGNTPGNNQAQNKQFRNIAKKLGLSKDEQRMLHDYISHQGLGYQELLELAKELFNKK